MLAFASVCRGLLAIARPGLRCIVARRSARKRAFPRQVRRRVARVLLASLAAISAARAGPGPGHDRPSWGVLGRPARPWGCLSPSPWGTPWPGPRPSPVTSEDLHAIWIKDGWQFDVRYFAPAGLAAKGAKHFSKRLAFDRRTIPVIHSSVTLDNLNLVRRQRQPAAAAQFCRNDLARRAEIGQIAGLL